MTDRHDSTTPKPDVPYESPRADDIDATHGPVEAVGGVQQSPPSDAD